MALPHCRSWQPLVKRETGPTLMDKSLQSYLTSLVPERPAELQAMEQFARESRFPIIGPTAGYFCYILCRLVGARSVFEMGSGYGYSTAWFARAIAENGGGDVYHVVWDENLSQMARQHLATLDYGARIHYVVDEAINALRQAEGPFDLIFNDIDKEAYPQSLPIIEEKLRAGGALIIDNALWGGRVYDEAHVERSTEGVREVTRMLYESPKWEASIVPIADGLTVALRK